MYIVAGGGRWSVVVLSDGHVASGRASSTVTVHVSFLEKLSNVAHRRRGGGAAAAASNLRAARMCEELSRRDQRTRSCAL